MSEAKYNSLKKDDLIIALLERDNEIAELSEALESALSRLTEAEKGAAKGKKVTTVDAGEDGVYSFSRSAIRIGATVYTADELKLKTQLVVELYKKGSELIKKIK